jgi:hypothetical protein
VAKLDEALSNVLQLSRHRVLLAQDFNAELDPLYLQHVAPPRRAGVASLRPPDRIARTQK